VPSSPARGSRRVQKSIDLLKDAYLADAFAAGHIGGPSYAAAVADQSLQPQRWALLAGLELSAMPARHKTRDASAARHREPHRPRAVRSYGHTHGHNRLEFAGQG